MLRGIGGVLVLSCVRLVSKVLLYCTTLVAVVLVVLVVWWALCAPGIVSSLILVSLCFLILCFRQARLRHFS